MWPKKYRDYPPDTPLKKEQISSGRGICEMHESNGWGDQEEMRTPSKGIIQAFLSIFLKKERDENKF